MRIVAFQRLVQILAIQSIQKTPWYCRAFNFGGLKAKAFPPETLEEQKTKAKAASSKWSQMRLRNLASMGPCGFVGLDSINIGQALGDLEAET